MNYRSCSAYVDACGSFSTLWKCTRTISMSDRLGSPIRFPLSSRVRAAAGDPIFLIQDRSLHGLAQKFENQIFTAAMNVEDYNNRINKKLSKVQKVSFLTGHSLSHVGRWRLFVFAISSGSNGFHLRASEPVGRRTKLGRNPGCCNPSL